MSGHFDEATHFGEAVHGRLPKLIAPLRFLSALYFHARDEKQAERVVERLRRLEPGFNPSDLRDPDYPSESLRKSALIDSVPMRQV